MDRKIGYALLLCGVIVIASSALMMWKMFYGGMPAPEAFKSEITIPVVMSSGMAFNVPLPPQINRLANLGLGFMLMFFLTSAGGAIGSLGVKLINKPPQAGPPSK